ncbi:hypothetical protein ET445_16445 [Agromyces protaetiae]|uniref:Capsular polysaccharide biosynthesis protein n=1 Tax=Agromyces protaetiae TaxID=2509455 RepID=A0A4P6FFL5_9MICO|nr:hypothetical protein [Agromyces protaetiae]QAY74686.1 hypothetical protein ET445_16445 [Agromyces protaetiae]
MASTEQPTYVRRLLRQKILLICGAVIALVAGLSAGFGIVNGKIEPRAVKTYQATTNVLLTSPEPSYYQVEIPGEPQAIPQPDPVTGQVPADQFIIPEPVPVDLDNSALVLSYLASSDEIVDAVASRVGGLADGETITATRRSTPPAGDERFAGRLILPVIEIAATAQSADRAERLADEATGVFMNTVVARQDEAAIPPDIRLVLQELNKAKADEGVGSNPAIPVVVVAFGVFLLFVALALLVESIRERRQARDGGDGDRPRGGRGGGGRGRRAWDGESTEDRLRPYDDFDTDEEISRGDLEDPFEVSEPDATPVR